MLENMVIREKIKVFGKFPVYTMLITIKKTTTHNNYSCFYNMPHSQNWVLKPPSPTTIPMFP